MSKKSLSVLLVIISIVLLTFVGSFSDALNKNDFNSLQKSNTQIQDIIKDKKQTESELVDEIYFDGNKLFLDKTTDTLFYSLVEGSNTAYNPKVSWIGNGVKVIIEDKQITDNLIENNESIEITTYKDNKYHTYNLKCTTLPLINIDVNMDSLNKEDEELLVFKEIKMNFEIFDNRKDVNQRHYKYDGKINVRGNATKWYAKKGFKLELKTIEVEEQKQQISLLGLRQGKDYILYAAHNDQEKIRNVFSSNLWYESCAKNNSFGLDNGMYYKYCELFLNNEYWGLYALGFPIDEIQEQINPYNINENIYEKVSFYEIEYLMDEAQDFRNGYQLKTNKTKEKAWQPLKDFYSVVLHSEDGEEIYDVIDIDNAIDIYLFYNFVQGSDNVSRDGEENLFLYNTFLISKENEAGTKILYAPWDLDKTWGEGLDDEVRYDYGYNKNSIMYINPVEFLKELGDKNINELIKERYDYLRDNEWSDENLMSILNKYESNIFKSGAFARDANKWASGEHIENNIGLSEFKEYVIKRVNYVDKYMNENY